MPHTSIQAFCWSSPELSVVSLQLNCSTSKFRSQCMIIPIMKKLLHTLQSSLRQYNHFVINILDDDLCKLRSTEKLTLNDWFSRILQKNTTLTVVMQLEIRSVPRSFEQGFLRKYELPWVYELVTHTPSNIHTYRTSKDSEYQEVIDNTT